MAIFTPATGNGRATRALIDTYFNGVSKGEIEISDAEREKFIQICKDFGFVDSASILDKREERLRQTERSSKGSVDLWKMDAKQITELFHKENQKTIDCLSNSKYIKQLEKLVHSLKEQQAKFGGINILIGGAGSSGRYAYLADLFYGSKMSSAGYSLLPWIAGGIKALVTAVEHAEDNAKFSYDAFNDFLSTKKSFALPSSAGLSAACVFGILKRAYELDKPCGILGMNPLTRAATNSISGFEGESVSSVLLSLKQKGLLNELLFVRGAEALTGSSRLGAGDATLISYSLLAEALATDTSVTELVAKKQQALREEVDQVYLKQPLSEIMVAMSRCIDRGGRIIYLSNSAVSGVIGMTDGSECPPTFGAPEGVIRSYFKGGWFSLRLKDKGTEYLETLSDDYPCDLHTFFQNEKIKSTDTVIVLGSSLDSEKESLIKSKTENLFQIEAQPLALKMALNCVSSGAFTLSGAVVLNFMAHMKPSNSKLIDRAARIVSKLTEIDLAVAANLVSEAMGIYTEKTNMGYTIPYCIARANEFDRESSLELLELSKNPWGMINVRELLLRIREQIDRD